MSLRNSYISFPVKHALLGEDRRKVGAVEFVSAQAWAIHLATFDDEFAPIPPDWSSLHVEEQQKIRADVENFVAKGIIPKQSWLKDPATFALLQTYASL